MEIVKINKPTRQSNKVVCDISIGNRVFTVCNEYFLNNEPFENLSLRMEGYVSVMMPHVIFNQCRLIVDGHLDDVFVNNLYKLRDFYNDKLNKTYDFALEFDTNDKPESYEDNGNRNTLCCFSGGVDSFCTLMCEQSNIDTLFYGINYDVYSNQNDLLNTQLNTIHDVARKYDKHVLVCTTNLKSLINPMYNYANKLTIPHCKWLLLHSPCKVCNFYNLTNTYNKMLISGWNTYESVHEYDNIKVCLDSNKLSDELFSSRFSKICHYGNYSRMEKTRTCINIDKTTFFKYVRVCWQNLVKNTQTYNCSKCPKCVITMLFIGLISKEYINDLKTFDTNCFEFDKALEYFINSDFTQKENFGLLTYQRDLINALKNKSVH